MNSLGLSISLFGAAIAIGLMFTPSVARATQASTPADQHTRPFRRIASFPVFLNGDVDQETVAEIVAAANHGTLLVYTDSQQERIGFVDISDPAAPQPAGTLALPGEPTSVAVRGGLALVCTNTSPDYVHPSGVLVVIDIQSRQIIRSLDLGGQPDSISLSPGGHLAAVVVENERDEDLGSGEPPQLPAGKVVIVDMFGPPALWATRDVELVGVAGLYPEDPEPEFIDVNAFGIAALTLQENNHIALINLWNGHVLSDFRAGTVDLHDIDTSENGLIEQTASLLAVPREPDAIVWTSASSFATANEGDLFGGSRGFSSWSAGGGLRYESGNELEHLCARLGHYPEGRSQNKGCEAEGIEYARFGDRRLLFVGCERSNLVFVFELRQVPGQGWNQPVFQQALPTGVAPEGLLAIPARDLLVVACEADSRDDKIRSTIMIYRQAEAPNYPTIVSANRGTSSLPIPWGALSGLASDPHGDEPQRLYSVHDSFYRRSRLYALDVAQVPAQLESEFVLEDSQDLLLDALTELAEQIPGLDDLDIGALINSDRTVNLDLEGVALGADGGFWVASEGSGQLEDGVSDADHPFESPNLLLRLELDASHAGAPPSASIADVILPPTRLTRNQSRFGFEGVAVLEGAVFVAFQRAWRDSGDDSDQARIGRFDLATRSWTFAHYPLDAPSSPAGGWVGLSELTHVGGDEFAVIERDNQGGPDASIKRIYSFSITGVRFRADAEVAHFAQLDKVLRADLLESGAFDRTGGPVPEKLEGMALGASGSSLWIVNDNDGVDDNNGETQLLELESVLQ